ncbi:hypothetical protein AB6A40_002359 [Gnathostoma spinigerum]|uniref:WD repeat-containing protein 44 n=1 Tax=Gnathostoma spinigerum TaxID=75299 RepID=A0ABD6E6C8_9BILA
MMAEFGGSIYPSSLGIDDDAGSASGSVSLASWGRALLMEHNKDMTGPFFPADSVSTKGMPANSVDASYLAGSVSESPCSSPAHFVRPSHPRVYETPNAPPTRPPPPLPSSPCPKKDGVLIELPRSPPPPLPPRNPATVKLPSALPVRAVATIVSEDLLNVSEGSAMKSINDNIAASGGPTPPCSSPDAYGRRRGHVKTNSLDRGLSLAKSMKTGPFPPPANKSNSLKRDMVLDGNAELSSMISLDGGEEDLRNSDAQGVIHQITSSIMTEEAIKEVSARSDLQRNSAVGRNSRLSAVGEEVSLSPPSTVPRPLSYTDETLFEPPINEQTVVALDMAEKSGDHVSSRADHSDSRNETICDTAKDSKEKEKDTTLKRAESPENGRTMSLAREFGMQNYIDPITRDVERRMSMKGQEIKGSENENSNIASAHSTSGIGRATTFVKGYGCYASSLLRGALSRAKHVMGSSSSASRLPKEDEESGVESEREESGGVSESTPIVRPKSAKKGPFDFEGMRLVQELNNEHTGAVWCMKFSLCGRLLATAGQDNIIRVWVLRNHLSDFNSMRDRYNSQSKKNSLVSVDESLFHNSMSTIENELRASSTTLGDSVGSMDSHEEDNSGQQFTVMAPKPFCTYRGHTADVLDLSWSRHYFILSSGMDRTVKLWHLFRPEYLCCFQHMDFVTCIAFMPKDDRYFLSGSLDGKLRLWHIPDKKVALWNEVEQVKFITAIAFVKNGRFAVVGTYDGRCFFYSTDQLKYHTVIDVRSSRGKNARGHKVTGLSVHGDKLLVTSNDSRIRMYDLRDMALTCKFKGAQNERSQIRASFSPDGRHIVCGSEDRYIYVWTTSDLPSSLTVRRDRNDFWQRIRCHSACVSAAIFAPRPQLILSLLESRRAIVDERRFESAHINKAGRDRDIQGDVIVSADLSGSIKILANRTRIKAGASHFFKNY